MRVRILTNPIGLWSGLITAALIAAMLPMPVAGADNDSGPLVIVNERPISRKKVVDLLMESHGLRMMQQLIALELAKQESRRQKLKVTEADVQEQFRRALEEIAPDRDAKGVTLTQETKRQALEQFLVQKCLTMTEFMIAMERNAHLRKAVEQDIQVDDATLREEFARTYGEKVEVRHIEVNANDTRTLHEVLDLLGRGHDFAEVARQLSINPESAARGGLLEPFTFIDKLVPPLLRDVAFSLTPGETSNPTLVGERIHILKLERRIPPEDARFEDVRDKVERRLRERVIRQKMEELVTKLLREASIRVMDRRLKREFEDLLKKSAAP